MSARAGPTNVEPCPSLSLSVSSSIRSGMAAKGRHFSDSNCSLDFSRGSTRGPIEVDADDSKDYLPGFAVGTEMPCVKNAGLTARKDPFTGKVSYTFKVEWYDNGPDHLQFGQVKSDDQGSALNLGARCDGPCCQLVFGEMKQFGDCDHNICANCYEVEKSVKMFDGTPGCCNVNCVDRELNLGELVGLRSADSCSSCSNISCKQVAELIQLRILIFETGANGRISRKKIDREVSSKTFLRKLKGFLNKLIDCLDECEVYYSNTQNIEKDSLNQLLAFDKGHIASLLDGSDSLNLVISAPNITLFRK